MHTTWQTSRYVMLLLLFFTCAGGGGSAAPAVDGREVSARRADEEVERLYQAGKYQEALPLAQRQVHTWESIRGKDHPDVATALMALGRLHLSQSEYKKVEPLARRALTIREVAFGELSKEVASCLTLLANLHKEMGDKPKAEPLHLRVLKIREATFGSNHPEVAATLNNLADLYMSQHRWDEAERLFLRALKICKAPRSRDDPCARFGTILRSNLSLLYDEIGAYEKAQIEIQSSLTTQRLLYGSVHPLIAKTLSTLGMIESLTGEYGDAEEHLLQSLEMSQSVFGEKHNEIAIVLGHLAHLYSLQGADEKLRPLIERALGIHEALFGKMHALVALDLSNLALIICGEGKCQESLPLLERALEIDREVLGMKCPEVAFLLRSIAKIYHKLGALDKAQSRLFESLQMINDVLPKEHPEQAMALFSIAELQRDQGRQNEALQRYASAVEIIESTLGKGHPDVAEILIGQAALHVERGEVGKALPIFARALGIADRTLRLTAGEARLEAFQRKLNEIGEMIFSIQSPDAAPLQLAAALLLKGRTLDEAAFAAREMQELQQSDADRPLAEQLLLLRRQLARRSMDAQGQVVSQTTVAGLEGLSTQLDELERKLARRSGAMQRRRATPGPDTIVTSVAQALPKDAALVEVVLHRPYRFSPGAERWGAPRYTALVLTPGGHVQAISLGAESEVNRAIGDLLAQIAERSSAPAATRSAAMALYRRAFAPLRAALGGARRTFLSLDGSLQLVPFAALHDGRDFLLGRQRFVYLNSGRDLLRTPQSNARPTQVVVLADPDLDHGGPPTQRPPLVATLTRGTRAATLASLLARIGGLPGTAREAEMLAQRLPGARLLAHAQATEGALLALTGPTVLHVASHGLFLDDATLFTRGGGAHALPTLSRSALVLAGASVRPSGAAPSGGEDGLATALEIAGMDLQGTQLVVLSACDSGRGEVRRGQGVYGLRRAFFIAGAETLVTSLWKIDDQATAALMDRYYAGLLTGGGRVEALERAMADTRRQRRHPYYWAPFIAFGQEGPLQGIGASYTPAQIMAR